MKQVVLTKEKNKVISIGVISVVDDRTLLQLEEEARKNANQKEAEINELKNQIMILTKRLERVEKELAYNRGEIDEL